MNYYFITGTSKGLGKALTEKILSEGNAKVFGLGRNSTIINPNYTHVKIDLSLVCELEDKIKIIFKNLMSPEKIVLINNAGILGEVKYSGENSSESLINVFSINTIAPVIIINSFVKAYSKSDCAKRIINISSGAGKNPIDGWSSYCSSKAALDMYSRVVDDEQKNNQSDIKIYSIAPGIVDTDMQNKIRKSDKKDFSMIEKFKEYKNNNELSTPKSVADKYWYFLQNEDKFEDVILDVREF